MAEVKGARPRTESEAVVERAKDFWGRFGKTISIALGGVILVVGGFLIYKNFIQGPKEKKAADAIAKVQMSFDSTYNAAGETSTKFIDQTIADAENVIKQYGSTKGGNLARFYAGAAYLKKGNFDKAISHLKEFETDAPQIQAKAYKLLGDAYAEKGNPKDAVDYYKKAARHFEEDDNSSSEALFLAAYLSDKVLNDKSGAVELYKEVKTKYSQTQWAFEAEKYLATHGVYNVE
jgi:predicted negative regulator of RcsB-dependent stress response